MNKRKNIDDRNNISKKIKFDFENFIEDILLENPKNE